MKKEVAFTCELPNGIHARPANHLEAVCSKFNSDITLKNLRNGNQGSAKSVLSLVGTDTLLNDPCSLIIEGDDAESAFETLAKYIQEEFPHCDEALEVMEQGDVLLPQSLMHHNPNLVHAKRLSAGIAKGKLVRYTEVELSLFNDAESDMSFAQAKQTVTETLLAQAETLTARKKKSLMHIWAF